MFQLSESKERKIELEQKKERKGNTEKTVDRCHCERISVLTLAIANIFIYFRNAFQSIKFQCLRLIIHSQQEHHFKCPLSCEHPNQHQHRQQHAT